MNKKYIQILTFVIGITCTNNVFADVKVGIGSQIATFISFSNNVVSGSFNTISVPINIHNKMLIEPEFIYTNSDTDNESGSNVEETRKGVVIGVYGYITTDKIIKPYYGIRLGLTKFDAEFTSATGEFSNSFDDTSKIIAPTFGAEVNIIGDLSIAAEISVSYIKSDNSTTVNTDSRLKLRFLF